MSGVIARFRSVFPMIDWLLCILDHSKLPPVESLSQADTADTDDQEVPQISLQEMLDDLVLDDEDMPEVWRKIFLWKFFELQNLN